MNLNTHHISDRWRSQARAIGVILVIAFVGPILGLLLAVFGVVLAPPWTFLTGWIYVPMACLGLPFGLVAVSMQWVGKRGLVVALVVVGIVTVFYLALVGPWLPGGMTDCQAMAAPLPRVRYACVSTSSDDPGYRHEFMLEGRAGWPVMRLVPSQP